MADTIASLVGMLQLKIFPEVLGSLPITNTLFDNIPLAPSYSRIGQTNTARITRDINVYTVKTLADGAQVTQEDKVTDFIDITAIRKYVSINVSAGMNVQALEDFFRTRSANMLESLYRDAVTQAYSDILGTAGIGVVGVDNTAITRAVIQESKQIFNDADIPVNERFMALTSTSENDVASIADYNRAFSNNGNIPSESVPNAGGFSIVSTPESLLPDGALGKENLILFLPAASRLSLDETPPIQSPEKILMARENYRGLDTFFWMENDPKTLGGFIFTVSTTSGVGVVRESGVIQVLGR